MADPLDGFTERVARRRSPGYPLVTLTYAQSLDGSIAARRDQRLTLSGDESKAMTHRLRAAHGGIMVGIGTVLADDPRLTARLTGGPDPQPVILDSQLRFPAEARLLSNPIKPWIITSQSADPRRAAELEQAGARVFRVNETSDGMLDLDAALVVLGKHGIDSLMVEGGAKVITRFLAERLPDWLVITIAPVFVGGVRAVEEVPSAEYRVPSGETRVPSGTVGVVFPEIVNVRSTQMGRDIVLWGDLKSEVA